MNTRMIKLALAALITWMAAISNAEAQQGYSGVAIVHPGYEQTLHDNEGNVLIVVDVQPDLEEGDEVVVLLDGDPIARAPETAFSVTGVERGEHAVEAHIVDAGGNTLATSDAVTFFVWQASVLFPGRPR